MFTARQLGVLWLLSSAEVFSTAKRIEWGMPRSTTAQRNIPTGGQGACVPREQLTGLARFKELAVGFIQGRGSRECSAEGIMNVRGGHGPVRIGGLSMSFPVFKLLLQLLLTGLNVACWLVPMKVKRFSQNKELISLANAFSGGVFLSLAFGHMIPHSTHGFEALDMPHNWPFFVTLGGYLLIFFVEKIAFDAHGLLEGDGHGHHHYDASDLDTSESKNGGKAKAVASPSHAAPANTGRSAVILLFALAIHSIFETMALGLSDTPLQATLLATSIALHQPAESIALLVAFLKSGMPRPEIVRYLSAFSVVGSIGVILGIAVDSLASEIWDSVFVALAAGTFIYVGCTEIVAEEFEEQDNKWKKFFSLIAGVVIVGAITVVTEGWEH